MRFRRKSAEAETTEQVDAASADALPEAGDAPEPAAGAVALDVDDLDEEQLAARVDLGSLLIAPQEGAELRLQVDEESGTVQSVVLAGSDSAVDVRAFAASRNGDLWSEVRPLIAADMARRGGIATEVEGSFGTEIHCEITAEMEDGRTGVQASRIVGVNGPRWLLRATFLGAAAHGGPAAEPWEAMVRDIAVRRGAGALPPGEVLPLELPDQARRLDS